MYWSKRNLTSSRSSFCSTDLEFKEYEKLDENCSDNDIFLENVQKEAESLLSSAKGKANKKTMKSTIDTSDNFIVQEEIRKLRNIKSDSFILDNYFRSIETNAALFPRIIQRRALCPNTTCSTAKLTEQNLERLNDKANENSWQKIKNNKN